jgi:hypothetical protein
MERDAVCNLASSARDAAQLIDQFYECLMLNGVMTVDENDFTGFDHLLRSVSARNNFDELTIAKSERHITPVSATIGGAVFVGHIYKEHVAAVGTLQNCLGRYYQTVLVRLRLDLNTRRHPGNNETARIPDGDSYARRSVRGIYDRINRFDRTRVKRVAVRSKGEAGLISHFELADVGLQDFGPSVCTRMGSI